MLDSRELGILKFNMRVLEEAEDTSVPPLERLKFLSVASGNIDEFFMVRIGKLTENFSLSREKTEELSDIKRFVKEFYKKEKYAYDSLCDTLFKNNIRILPVDAYIGGKKNLLEKNFHKSIKPFLSVRVVNSADRLYFPKNKETFCVARLSSKSGTALGLITKNPELEDVVMTKCKDFFEFILTDELILKYADSLFSGYEVKEKSLMRITGSADLTTLENELSHIKDHKLKMKKLLRRRKKLSPVRIELSNGISKELKGLICENGELFYINKSPLSFAFSADILKYIPNALKNSLSYPPAYSKLPEGYSNSVDMLEALKSEDMLFHYPYDSMKPFLRFLEQSAYDEKVQSIKITLYRINKNSRIVQSLIKAAELGKDVIAVVELRARFDEENNINYSELLEKNGVTVIYGPEKFKVHSKLCLVERIENGKICRYTHIGTGNYNENTANAYTDLNLLTCSSALGNDAALFFHNILSDKFDCEYKELIVSPYGIEKKIAEKLDALERLEKHEKENARVIFKCNALTDKKMIEKIIRTCESGVKTDLIVRGACRLVPDTPELKENMRIVSIVGRFLEHSRIYAFFRGDESEIYISSADLMTRNLKRRIETAVLIKDKNLKKRIIDYLEKTLSDDVKARVMNEKAEYIKKENKINFDSQKYFLEERKNED